MVVTPGRLWKESCQNQVRHPASDEAKELNPFAGDLGQKPGCENQRWDHEEAAPQNLKDALGIAGRDILTEDRRIVLLQAVLDNIKEEPAPGSAEKCTPVR